MRLIFTKIQQLNTTYKWQHEVMTAKLVARKKKKRKGQKNGLSTVCGSLKISPT